MTVTTAAIWHDVLGVDGIGVHDNFFDVGGHSLLSMRVLAEIDRALGHRLSPRSMFMENLRQIAAHCDRAAAAGSGDAAFGPGFAGAAAAGLRA